MRSGGGISHSGSTITPFGFGGKATYQSDTSGLVLMGHRYYDSSIGRFLSADPAKSGTNWYAYVGNNPLTKTDPTGMHEIYTPDSYDDSFAAFTDSFLGSFEEYDALNGIEAPAATFDGHSASQAWSSQDNLTDLFPNATASLGLGGADQVFVFGFGGDLGLGLRSDGTLMITGDIFGNYGGNGSWGYGGTAGPEGTVSTNNLTLNPYGFGAKAGPMSNTNVFGGIGPYGGSVSSDGSSTTASVGGTLGLAHQQNKGQSFSIGINPIGALYNSINIWGQKNVIAPLYQMYGH